MVIRQKKYKTEDFFKFRLHWLDVVAIPKLKNIILSGELDERRTEITMSSIAQMSLELTLLKYTSGTTIEEIGLGFQSCVSNYLKLFEINYTMAPDRILEQYIECIWLLSFCYFFNTPLHYVEKLSEHIPFVGNDMLIDRLAAASIPDHPISIGKLAFPEIYKPLTDALSFEISRDNRNEKISLLLRNYYPLLKKYDVTWHNDYKEKDLNYCHHFGYWIFELGALVAAIGWDDTAFRNHEFYPKDLVDWKFAQRPKDQQYRI